MSYCRRYILLRNNGHSQLLLNQNFIIPNINKYHCLLIVFAIILVGCSTKTQGPPGKRQFGNTRIWKQSNPRIKKYVQVYSNNKHVKTCLDRATNSRYLHYIHRVFININCLRNLHICQYWNRVLTKEPFPGPVHEACGNLQKQPQKIMDFA